MVEEAWPMPGSEMSESEQMYLVATAMLIEEGMTEPVPLPALAEARSVVPASVNHMVRKLAEEGFINYIPYRGVELTPLGAAVARRILRFRRLWEVFLVERLGMPDGEADALACRLEHVTTDDVAHRLSTWLGDPQVSPRGRPIPAPEPVEKPRETVPLGELAVTRTARVSHVEGDAVLRAFLADQGVGPGCTVTVLAQGGDGRMLLQAGGRSVQLAPEVASQVQVIP